MTQLCKKGGMWMI